MIVINNLEEMQKHYVGKLNTYVFSEDVEFTFNVEVDANINACDIKARNINARDINARDINAWNIKAWSINAWNIKAFDINAWSIKACDINASDINAGNIKVCDIKAININACDINYYALCVAYRTFKCVTVEGRRENSKHFCLDSEIEYVQERSE